MYRRERLGRDHQEPSVENEKKASARQRRENQHDRDAELTNGGSYDPPNRAQVRTTEKKILREVWQVCLKTQCKLKLNW